MVVVALVSIQTPFPRGERRADGIRIIPILQQHVLAVDTIKRNRAAENLDTITANRGKLRYECVWCEGDAGGEWVCMFALDIYDWRDLGSHTAAIPSRGCVGMYLLPDRSVPEAAARDLKQSVLCQTTMSWIHSRRSGRRGFERD